MNEMYARCEIFPGTFDSEAYVVIGSISALVDKRNVKVNRSYPSDQGRVIGSVLVYIVDEEAERTLVELPGQSVVGGLRTWLPREVLAAA